MANGELTTASPEYGTFGVVGVVDPSIPDDVVARVVGVVERLPELESLYYGYDDTPQNQRDQALESYEAELPDRPVILSALGIPQMGGTRNVDATTNFRKEDVIEVSEDQFRVVTDEAGDDWLMKSIEGRPDPNGRIKIGGLMVLISMQTEVFAYRGCPGSRVPCARN